MKKGKKTLIIVIALLVVFSICGALYYNYLVSNEKDNIREIARKNSNALLDTTEKIKYGETLSYDELVKKLVDRTSIVEGSKIRLLVNNTEILEKQSYKVEEEGKITITVALEKDYTYKIITSVTEKVKSTREIELEVEGTKNTISED